MLRVVPRLLRLRARPARASKPEDVGFSSERMKRIAEAFQADVDRGVLPGAVVAVARNGKVAYFEAFGFQNKEPNT